MSIAGSTQGAITEEAYSKDSVGNSFQEGHDGEAVVKGLEWAIYQVL